VRKYVCVSSYVCLYVKSFNYDMYVCMYVCMYTHMDSCSKTDGTKLKEKIGGNSMTATSFVIAAAGAIIKNVPLFVHFADAFYQKPNVRTCVCACVCVCVCVYVYVCMYVCMRVS